MRCAQMDIMHTDGMSQHVMCKHCASAEPRGPPKHCGCHNSCGPHGNNLSVSQDFLHHCNPKRMHTQAWGACIFHTPRQAYMGSKDSRAMEARRVQSRVTETHEMNSMLTDLLIDRAKHPRNSSIGTAETEPHSTPIHGRLAAAPILANAAGVHASGHGLSRAHSPKCAPDREDLLASPC